MSIVLIVALEGLEILRAPRLGRIVIAPRSRPTPFSPQWIGEGLPETGGASVKDGVAVVPSARPGEREVWWLGFLTTVGVDGATE